MRTFFTITNNSIVILSAFLSSHLLLILLLLLLLLLKLIMLSVWLLMIYLGLLDLLDLLEGYSCSTSRTWTLRLKKISLTNINIFSENCTKIVANFPFFKTKHILTLLVKCERIDGGGSAMVVDRITTTKIKSPIVLRTVENQACSSLIGGSHIIAWTVP